MNKTALLTKIATDLGTDLATLQSKMSQATLVEVNEFTESLMNKIGKQMLTDMFNYKNPITSIFAKDAFQYGDGAEIMEVQVKDDSGNYDATKYLPENVKQKEILSTIIKTVDKKIFETEVSVAIVRGAFVNDTAFSGLIGQLVGVLEKALEVYLLNTLTTYVKTNVKNVKTVKAGGLLKNWVEIFDIAENMELPTKKYNLGFADPTDASVSDQTQLNISKLTDVHLFMNPSTLNKFKREALPSLYHIDEFGFDKFGGAHKLPLADNEVLVLDRRAFVFFWRIRELMSQAFARNLKVVTYLHAWLRYGIIPWANGVLVTLDNATS